jgi:TfoX/Sxy family transcriptional regulator of competence genes
MATAHATIEHLLRRLGKEATAKPMFGEYGLYFRGTLIGLVCDDRLFLKQTEAAKPLMGEHECAPPYPGAKPAIIVPEDLWDAPAEMRRLASATAAELASRPAHRPSKTRAPRARKTKTRKAASKKAASKKAASKKAGSGEE